MITPPSWYFVAVCTLAGAGFISGMSSRAAGAEFGERIDRHALVARHDITLDHVDPANPLQVGNGEFAFACDATGLQSLGGDLGTYAQWAWHSFPNQRQLSYDDTLNEYRSGERRVRYATKVDISGVPNEATASAGDWYRRSPHRLHLGRIALEMRDGAGHFERVPEPQHVAQTLDLWHGVIHSRYQLGGEPVEVTTCVHPRLNLVAVSIKSPLIRAGRLAVAWQFPYARFSDAGPSWDAADDGRHATRVRRIGVARADLERRLDTDDYHVSVAWSTQASFHRIGAHRFLLTPAPGGDTLKFVSDFESVAAGPLPSPDQTLAAAAAHWEAFWNSGGVIDLSLSRDPRWRELERRIVLAQYLTAIQTSGSSPPQESGLYANSWYGKFHLEMIAWHGVHYALWGRPALLVHWMRWLHDTGLPAARRQARAQGYAGARWLKMVDRDASWESPSPIGPFRLTQNGHVIYLAELLYRVQPTAATLTAYKDLVFDTADFMADFVRWDEATQRYLLGPPLLSGSEATLPASQAFNPTVELSYWFYGLRTAQTWRARLGLPRVTKWDEVLAHLSKPAVQNGRYLDTESHPGQWPGRPAWLEAYGCMPGVEIDPAVMSNNYEFAAGGFAHWTETWGCDFPMLAMTAARLGRPQEAVDWLLHSSERNAYAENGFNVAGSTPYLPAHGGLLWAVAMMAAGWDGGPDRSAPGFPNDGRWTVRWEGLHPAP